MTTAPITEAEVARILAGEMRIDERVQWMQKSHDAWAEATIRVRHSQRQVNLAIKLTVILLAPERFSISLLLDGAHRICAIDVGGSHENKHTDSNRWVHKTHEHRWTDACHGGWACEAGPFPTTLREAFVRFCEMRGIEFDGTWSDPPPAQLGLEAV